MNIRGYGNAETEAIIQLEEQIGFSLPSDYQKFLLEYNGGSARENVFFVSDLKERISLNVLFGLDVDKRLDLRTWYNEYKEDLLPYSLIIGHDPGTGIIILVDDPEDKGIYYWDHSFYFEQSNEEENTYKIADSFQAFIDKLQNP